MIEITATVNRPGLADLERRLQGLPLEVERELVSRALEAGARVIAAAAQAAAPLGSRFYQYGRRRVRSRRRIGQMRRAIRPIGKGRRQGTSIVLPIGFGAPGFYGRFIERGWTPTGPHAKWRSRHHLGARAARGLLQRDRRKIPGLQFMHRAAVVQLGPATDAVARSIGRGLEQWGT